jgi:hypothetical protein
MMPYRWPAFVLSASVLAAVWVARRPRDLWPGRWRDAIVWACLAVASAFGMAAAIAAWWGAADNDSPLFPLLISWVWFATGVGSALGLRKGAWYLGPTATWPGLVAWGVHRSHMLGQVADWHSIWETLIVGGAVAAIGVLAGKKWGRSAASGASMASGLESDIRPVGRPRAIYNGIRRARARFPRDVRHPRRAGRNRQGDRRMSGVANRRRREGPPPPTAAP